MTGFFMIFLDQVGSNLSKIDQMEQSSINWISSKSKMCLQCYPTCKDMKIIKHFESDWFKMKLEMYTDIP